MPGRPPAAGWGLGVPSCPLRGQEPWFHPNLHPNYQVQLVHVRPGRLQDVQRHGRCPELRGPNHLLRGLVRQPAPALAPRPSPLAPRPRPTAERIWLPPPAGATSGRATRPTASAAPLATIARARPRGATAPATIPPRSTTAASTATATRRGTGAMSPRRRAKARLPSAATGCAAPPVRLVRLRLRVRVRRCTSGAPHAQGTCYIWVKVHLGLGLPHGCP